MILSGLALKSPGAAGSMGEALNTSRVIIPLAVTSLIDADGGNCAA
jgi:hypothetical protein